jgi:subtilisin family serine protease
VGEKGMNKKIVGIFICMLLTGTAIPTIGTIIETHTINENELDNYYDNNYVPGEFIVKFKSSPTFYDSIETINKNYHVISMKKTFDDAEGTVLDNIYYFKMSDDIDVINVVNYYASLPFVEYAEPNYITKIDIFSKQSYQSIYQHQNEFSSILFPNDPYFSKQWYLDNTGQYNGTIDADIDAPEAWDIETGSEDVIIAIVDSGIDYTHPDLIDNIWINDDEIPDNDIDDDNNGYVDDVLGWDFRNEDSDPIDDWGHGTLSSGFAALGNNNIGIAGVCWNCKIMGVKIANETGWGKDTHTADGIKYAADNGADIILPNICFSKNLSVIRNAVDYAYDKGCVLIAPAGNNNRNKKYYPAAQENVIAVAATNDHDERCDEDDWGSPYGSNFGDWIDVAAPGYQTYTTMPSYHVNINDHGFQQNYDFLLGTSVSAPITVCLAALLLSRNSSLSPEEVKTLICENVDPYDSEYYIGTGRINAYKTLSALNTPPNNPDIDGPTSGKAGEEQEFNISATDLHNDDISYVIDWGDDSVEETFGPFLSGYELKVIHIWNEDGDYTIRAKAKDVYGAESEWSTFEISMPKNKMKFQINNLFERLVYHFPLFEKILNQII